MTTTDVIVIGAGPAGSAAATVLAERGIDVCVVERERFPRFHIGESLLPATLSALDRIGVRLDPDEHQYKAGARFLDESTGQEQTYWFHDTLPGTPDHAYQVERALFDGILADRAIRAGARDCTNDAWWRDREAGPALTTIRVPYLRLQFAHDHALAAPHAGRMAYQLVLTAPSGIYKQYNNLPPNQALPSIEDCGGACELDCAQDSLPCTGNALDLGPSPFLDARGDVVKVPFDVFMRRVLPRFARVMRDAL